MITPQFIDEERGNLFASAVLGSLVALVFLLSVSHARSSHARIANHRVIRHVNPHLSLGWVYGPWRRIKIHSTAYVVAPHNGCDPTGPKTATGTPARYADIAVDPHIFPFRTEFLIPGYGYGIARDTGGLIKGHRIDVAMYSCAHAIRWGYRSEIVAYRVPLHPIEKNMQ